MNTPPATHQQQQRSLLARPRVNALLESALRHPLTVITAGTGYGKTEAVRSYLEGLGADYLWLQLTPLDNYTERFWEIYTHSVKSKTTALASFMAGLGFPDTLEKIYQFTKQLSAHILSRSHCYLVLDDFHKIEDDSVINFIEQLAFSNLENLSIVLISRYPLPIDYSALYNNGLLARISVADLRFTPEETQAYFLSCGLGFSPKVLENIQTSTEGWPLALYLIGLHRQNDGRLFDDPIACTIPLLYSLIEIEIFSQYSEEIRTCFVKLSLLDSIQPELVKLVSGPLFAEMDAVLKANHFVYFNPQAGVYHIHRLFRRFLQSKKSSIPKPALGELYLKAGEWCAAQNKIVEALTYFEACRNYAGIWAILQTHTDACYSFEMTNMIMDICKRFPPEVHEQYPLARVYCAHLLVSISEYERAYRSFMAIIHQNECLPQTPTRRSVLGESYVGLAHCNIFRQDYAFADCYRKAGEYLPEGSGLVTPGGLYVGNHYSLVLFNWQPGSLQKMVDTLFAVRPVISMLLHGCGHGAEYLAAAEAEYWQGNLGTATEYAYQALYRGQEKRQHDIICSCYLMLMNIAFATGDYTKAVQQLETLEQYAAGANGEYSHGLNDVGQGIFHARTGNLDRIPPWVLSTSITPQVRGPFSIGREKLVSGMFLLQREEYHQAREFLQTLIRFYNASAANLTLLEAQLLLAICHMREGNTDAATTTFQEAHDMAIGNSLIMPFAELGQDMRALVSLVRDRGSFDDTFLDDICLKASTYAKNTAYIAAEYARHFHEGNSLQSKLTPRERDILALLCRGATREEIGSSFGISVSTVKTSLKSIYAKLGALNRADAVRIALAGGLLDEAWPTTSVR